MGLETPPFPGADFYHEAKSIGRRKAARVVVPSCAPPPQGWRTCYLLHAFGGNRLTWLDYLVHHELRMVLVFPESGRRWFINDVSGRNYEDYIMDDLISAVDSDYPTDRRASSRIVGGFSMGGAAAIYLSLRHPEMFSGAFSYGGAFYAPRREGDPYSAYRSTGCMMPTEEEHERVWGSPGSQVRKMYDPDTLIGSASSGPTPKMIIEVGCNDYPRVVEQNRKMNEALVVSRMPHLYRECQGDHSWVSAAASAERAIRELASNAAQCGHG